MNARKEKALHALLTTNTLAQAAEQAEVTPKTLYNYLHTDAEFLARYEAEMSKLVSNATEMLQKTSAPAIEALQLMIVGSKVPPAVRVQACRAVLDYTIKLTELNDICRRIDTLEQSATERGPR